MVAVMRQSRTACLPARQSLQNSNVTGRQRVSFLPRKSRVYQHTIPKGLPSSHRLCPKQQFVSEDAYSCGNSAFQVLLNIPIFINFVRTHAKRRCDITDCLTCAIADVASFYWVQVLDQPSYNALCERLDVLWQRCLKVIWSRTETNQGQAGWIDIDVDVYTESLLLSFLVGVQNQLEKYPSDFQTFQRMFTSHVARRWKCSFGHCGHVATPSWESTLYLPVDVQKPGPHNTHTTVIEGLNHGLKRWIAESCFEDISTTTTRKCEKCGKCGQTAATYNEIVNLPEVLILVRNTEELASRDLPDIPYSEKLELEVTNPATVKTVKASFELQSGTADSRPSRGDPRRSIAFARGATSSLWYGIDNEKVEETVSLADFDKLQRPSPDRAIYQCFFPEMLIYYRTDWTGVKNYGQEDPIAIAPATPLIMNSAYLKRQMIGLSISDIFTQKIGKGLLKFKVDICPAEPQLGDIVDFTIHMGYEVDNRHWDGIMQGKMNPIGSMEGDGPYNPPETPFELNPVTRARKRNKGESPSNAGPPPIIWQPTGYSDISGNWYCKPSTAMDVDWSGPYFDNHYNTSIVDWKALAQHLENENHRGQLLDEEFWKRVLAAHADDEKNVNEQEAAWTKILNQRRENEKSQRQAQDNFWKANGNNNNNGKGGQNKNKKGNGQQQQQKQWGNKRDNYKGGRGAWRGRGSYRR